MLQHETGIKTAGSLQSRELPVCPPQTNPAALRLALLPPLHHVYQCHQQPLQRYAGALRALLPSAGGGRARCRAVGAPSPATRFAPHPAAPEEPQGGRKAQPPEAATHAFVDVQLQLLLRDALLDPLAEGRVARGPHAAVAVVDEAAALAVKGGGGRPVPAVLLGAEPIHRPPARPSAPSAEPTAAEGAAAPPPPLSERPSGGPHRPRGPPTPAGAPSRGGSPEAAREGPPPPLAPSSACGGRAGRAELRSAAAPGKAGTPLTPLSHTHTHTQNRLPGGGSPAPRLQTRRWLGGGRSVAPPLCDPIGE